MLRMHQTESDNSKGVLAHETTIVVLIEIQETRWLYFEPLNKQHENNMRHFKRTGSGQVMLRNYPEDHLNQVWRFFPGNMAIAIGLLSLQRFRDHRSTHLLVLTLGAG